MKKRLLSLAISLCMVLSLLPATALAAREDPVTLNIAEGSISISAGASFSDTQSHWANAAVTRWSDAGVILGDGKGAFRPNDPMTRAEFAVVLDRVMKFQTKSANPFTDVTAGIWYEDAVLKAHSAGVTSGTSATTMSPIANVTREQSMTMLGRALAIEQNDSLRAYSDSATVSPYAKGYVGGLSAKGYVQGSNGMINPQSNVTRAQVVTMLNNIVTTWANKSGETVTAQSKGITLVVASDVTVTGTANDILTTAGATGTLTLKDATVNGNLTLDEATTGLKLDGKTALDDMSIAGDLELSIAKDSKISSLVFTEGKLTLTGTGTLSSLTLGKGSTASLSKDVVISEIVNNSGAEVTYGSKTIKNGETLGGTTSTPGGNGGTTTLPTSISADDTTKLAADFAKVSGGAVTITLTGDLKDVTLTNPNVTEVNITGKSMQSLTVNTPNADVNLNAPVLGALHIVEVKPGTINVNAPVSGTISITKGGLNIASTVNLTAPIKVDGTATLKGNIAAVTLTNDASDVTLNDLQANQTPVVTSNASGAKLTMKSTNALTVKGDMDTIRFTAANNHVTIDSAVKNLTSAEAITVTGEGSVANMEVAGNAMLGVAVDSLEMKSAGTAVTAAPGTTPAIGNVKATGSVTMNTPADKVTAPNGATVTLAKNVTIPAIEAEGDITITGEGTAQTLAMTATGAATVKFDGPVNVALVTTTGNSTDITIDRTTAAGDVPKDAVKQAAKPTGVTIAAPTTVNGSATINVAEAVATAQTLEYSNDKGVTYATISAPKTDVAFDHNTTSIVIYVRTAAIDGTLASEPIVQQIAKPVGVKTATIVGNPVVGQMLTAVANADANGTIKYQWYTIANLVETPISGATTNTWKLTDAQVGQTIKVTISNYDAKPGATATSSATAVVTADQTAWLAAVTDSAAARAGVAILPQDGGTANNVPKGQPYVTHAENMALANLIVTFTSTTKQAEVDTATKNLLAGIATYNEAKKKLGTMADATELAKKLLAEIAVAKSMYMDHNSKVYVTVTDSAQTAAPHAVWVTQAEMTAFTDAIAAAENLQTTNVDKLTAGILALSQAQAAFGKVIKLGAAIDKTDLLFAITNAEKNQASVTVTNTASEVLNTVKYVPVQAATDYGSAIDKAKNLTVTTQQSVVDALRALNTATATFDAAKKLGEKVPATKPNVTEVKAVRTSDTTATVTFKTDRAGAYRIVTKARNTEAWTVIDNAGAVSVPVTMADTSAGAHTLTLYVSDTTTNPEAGNITVVTADIPALGKILLAPMKDMNDMSTGTHNPALVDIYEVTAGDPDANNVIPVTLKATNIALHRLRVGNAGINGYWVGISEPKQESVKILQAWGTIKTDEELEAAFNTTGSGKPADAYDSEYTVTKVVGNETKTVTYGSVYFNFNNNPTDPDKANKAWIAIQTATGITKYQITFNCTKGTTTTVYDQNGLTAALNDHPNINTINLARDFDTTIPFLINRAVTIHGNNHTITATAQKSTPDMIKTAIVIGNHEKSIPTLTPLEDAVVLKDLTVVGPNTNKTTGGGEQQWDNGEYGIKVFCANNVTLDNVTVTEANAGIQLNSSTVNVKNKLTVTGNEFGGIELAQSEDQQGPSTLEFAAGAELINEREATNAPSIWQNTKAAGTVTGLQGLHAVPQADNEKIHYYINEANLSKQRSAQPITKPWPLL